MAMYESQFNALPKSTEIWGLTDVEAVRKELSYWRIWARKMEEADKEQEARYVKSTAVFWLGCQLRHLDEWYYLRQLKIKDSEQQIVRFEPNAGQMKIRDARIEAISAGKPVRLILLKCRQFGGTTFIGATGYVKTRLERGVTALIISHKESSADHIFNMYRRFLRFDPCTDCIDKKQRGFYCPHYREVAERVRMGEIEYLDKEGGGVQISSGWNSEDARSHTYGFIHASEVAYWREPDKTMAALLEAAHYVKGNEIYVESTANGVGDWLHNRWRGDKRDGWNRIFVAWHQHEKYVKPFEAPEEKEEFMRDRGQEVRLRAAKFKLSPEQQHWWEFILNHNYGGDVEMLKQEHPSEPDEAFMASGRSAFSAHLTRHFERAQQWKEKDAIQTFGFRWISDVNVNIEPEATGDILVWSPPLGRREYLITVDTSEGIDRAKQAGRVEPDYSVISVWDRGRYPWDLSIKPNLAARWRGRIDPDVVADYAMAIGRWYNNAWMAPERNNHGLTVVKKMEGVYPCLFERPKIDIQESLDVLHIAHRVVYGWETNKKTRPFMYDALTGMLRDDEIDIYDEDMLSEMQTIMKEKKGEFYPQPGCHDDMVVTACIAAAILNNRGWIPAVKPAEVKDKNEFMQYLDDLKKMQELKTGQSYKGMTVVV